MVDLTHTRTHPHTGVLSWHYLTIPGFKMSKRGGGGGRGEVGLVFGFGFRVFVIFYRAGKRVE